MATETTPALASIDGEIQETAAATISVTDQGLIRGDGVFERIAVFTGVPFALREHLERLAHSCAVLSLPLDLDLIELEARQLLKHCHGDGALRIVLTRGGRRILLLEEVEKYEATIDLLPVAYRPNIILDGVKSISYAANMSATRTAASEGFGDALLVTPEGWVLESSTSSIFWADSEEQLFTPALELGILASIRREKLIEALPVEVGQYQLDRLLAAKEAFITSSTRGVQAVAKVGNQTLPKAPGPATELAKDTLAKIVKGDLGAFIK